GRRIPREDPGGEARESGHDRRQRPLHRRPGPGNGRNALPRRAEQCAASSEASGAQAGDADHLARPSLGGPGPGARRHDLADFEGRSGGAHGLRLDRAPQGGEGEVNRQILAAFILAWGSSCGPQEPPRTAPPPPPAAPPLVDRPAETRVSFEGTWLTDQGALVIEESK